MNDVFLEAAIKCSQLDEHKAGCCILIEEISDSDYMQGTGWTRDVNAFNRFFRPRKKGARVTYWAVSSGLEDEELRDFRVTMLLFAHAMRQTGDL